MDLIASPRKLVHLPGYTFDGHGALHFGDAGSQPVDLYRKRGGITAEVRVGIRNQTLAWPGAVEQWRMMQWKDHGDSVVAVRVSVVA